MSLEGAKLICLNADDDGQFETIPANGKTFKFGYYMDCDVVLEHPDAMGLQCVINCDAFGRVTIENRCSDQPITLDGKTLIKMRPLLHNTEICILDKKYLWNFDGNAGPSGFQMEDINHFKTPAKQTNKPQQPPNSEPARKWRRPLQTRLTIHSFAYYIKAGESPKDVETDENKPINIHKRIIDADKVPCQRLPASPPPPSKNISDFIDLNTPKKEQMPFSRTNQPLSCCKLSEFVITSYSPRETGIRQEKSFAVVQSPLSANKVKKTDLSLGPFQNICSPQTIHDQNNRPSMHLIDLITPKKTIPSASSTTGTLLKSTLKKNLPKGTSPQTPQKPKKIMDSSTPGSSHTVYSVRSTDDESVILLSDDCSGSPSSITKTPPRPRTPQSLMKRAILSSAKKATANKKFLNFTGSKQTVTPITSKNLPAVRFQSQSTPQRKSLGRCPSSADNLSAGKPRRSLVTSTPFRQRSEIVSSSASKRSLIINSQSSAKNESRNSLMLKQALSMTPTATNKSQNKSRKSVSFLQHVEKEIQVNADGVNELLSDTFTIGDDSNNDIELEQVANSYCKDSNVSPKNDKCQDEQETSDRSTCLLSQSKVSSSSEKLSTALNAVPGFNSEKPTESVVTELAHSLPIVSQVEIISDNQRQLDTQFHEEIFYDKQTPQSLKNPSKINASTHENRCQSIREDTDYDFDGVDEIFKTPKAKNVMILSSPKSISLKKTSSDSVELIHSTAEYDLSSNLDDLFQAPQIEFISRPANAATPTSAAPTQALSPEEAFDMLVGRPIVKKSYARAKPSKKQEQSPLTISNDSTFPKTDIEEWIDSVNVLLDDTKDEDEMSYIRPTMDDISRDPLMMHSVTSKQFNILNTPKDEFEMTIKGGNEIDNKSNYCVLKDPLETTVPRSFSPNISGIGLLDHTSESIFSETLAVSDDSSIKEAEKSMQLSDDHEETTLNNDQNQLNVSKEDEARREIEKAFKKFENQPKTIEEKRLSSTPEAKKPLYSKFASRRTMENQVSSDPKIDPDVIEVPSEYEYQFNAEGTGESFNERNNFENKNIENRILSSDFQNDKIKASLETSLVPEVKFTLENENTATSLELEFENKEVLPQFLQDNAHINSDHEIILDTKFIEQQVAPHPSDLLQSSCQVDIELELALENFDDQFELSEQQVTIPPELKKVNMPDCGRTLDNELVPEVKLDMHAANADRELELAFEHFEEQPEFSDRRAVKTPEPKKQTLNHNRKTLGSAQVTEVKLDLQVAKAERELELAFENFKEQPEFSEQRAVKTPDPKKVNMIDHRRTLGSAFVSEVKLDLQAAKAERELELAFEHFEEQPEFSEQRAVKTPDPKKVTMKDHRRTLGSALVSEVKLDLQAAKAERELELAFEHFEEQPEFSEQRAVKTPEPKKQTLKHNRRTLGSALVPEVKLDLQAAKAERELELAFENFEEQPEFSEQRTVKTPEPKKQTLKHNRRTLGSALVPEVKLDLQAAKAERELELAFENFEEQPEFSEQRAVKTPEPKKATMKDHRRTLGSALVSEVKLDLQAAKAERELELAFENFEEQPEFSEQRAVKTPEPKKMTMKDHRRTLGNALVSELKLDLQAAKAERELELAFENFEEQPEFSEQRTVKTPEPKKQSLKHNRRTLGSALVPEVKLDLEAAKAERELELAFENFEEQPEFPEQRAVKTPEPKKATMKDHRRTLGSALVSEVKLDLQAAKAERELELAFEHFEAQPEFSEQRTVKTPEPKKQTLKQNRRTLGSALVPEVKLDLQAAKAERELELAFENFEEQPEFSEQRTVKTPEPKKQTLKHNRRTLGSALVPEVKLDLEAAKAERELELAFENFEEQPEFSEQRAVKTPEPKKATMKDHRRTLGSALVSEVKLDLQAAKAERELELAFEHFEEQPEFSEQRAVKTPEPKKVSMKDHRRTLGSALVSELKLDLQAAKAERELELAFEHFEEQPEFSEHRAVKTPEPKKHTLKHNRRTLGSALVPEVKLDLQAAKAERELELAFENFEEQPEFSEQRTVKTPEPKKQTLKHNRRTLGSALVPEVKLDLEAVKAERELELAFENFEEQPEFSEQRAVKTPEPKKATMKDHRRTLGSALVSEVKLDLQAAKAERELELAFEHFEEQPEFSEQRTVKTPEPKKQTLKHNRRTLGSALVPQVKLDLKAAKAERELELAFENFEEQPEFSEQRAVKTPEPKKATMKDNRRTLGSALVSEVKLDLQAAKAERELELAFEHFEEQPEFSEQRAVKTPEPKKVSMKDHRRTLGSALVSELKLNLQAAKAERELELAFENFEEQPEFSEHRAVKTPEPKKHTLKHNRRTLGSALVPEVKLDLQAAKAERELELAFEHFEEQPEFSEQRTVKTPEPKKQTLKHNRRTLGSALVPEVKLDLEAAKAERELELAFEHFEEQPEFSEQRTVKTPEPKKQTLKHNRRTLGSALVPEVKLDLEAAKAERELELAFGNFEKQSEQSEQLVIVGKATDTCETIATSRGNLLVEKQLFTNAEVTLANVEGGNLPNNEVIQTQKSYNVTADFSETKLQSKKSTTTRSLRKRQKTTDEDDQSKSNNLAMKQFNTVGNDDSEEYIVSKAAGVRRTRKKTVDGLDDLKSTPAEKTIVSHKSKSQDNLLQMRMTRQNSIDFMYDTKKPTISILKTSKDEAELIKNTTQGSIENEANQAANISRNQRIRKISFENSEEPELHQILKPIDEEGINSESKLLNQVIETKSLISCVDKADEIICSSPIISRSRIRGRKAHLNVVLVESNCANSGLTSGERESQDDSLKNNVEIHDDVNNDCTEEINLTSESVPLTPLPLNLGGRRPLKTKKLSNLLVATLRKTRQDRVRQNIDVQTVDKVEDVKKDILTSNSNIIEDKRPGNDVPGDEADYEDIIQSTPVETKTRRRQLTNKQKISLKTGTKASSFLDQDDAEVLVTNVVESKKKVVKSTESEISTERQESVINVKKKSPSSALSLRTRGRKPILKHEVLSKNVNSDRGDTTIEGSVQDEQIIPTKEECVDKEILQFISDSTTESIKNLDVIPVEVKNPIPISPVRSNIRSRRAASKVQSDSESATPKRRVGRPKAVKKADLPKTYKDEAEKNVARDDERESQEIKNETPTSTKNSTPEITSNRRIGRSKDNKKKVSESEYKNEDLSKEINDEKTPRVAEAPLSAVLKSQDIENEIEAQADIENNIASKISGRRTAMKTANEIQVVKRGRKRAAAKEITESKSSQATEDQEESVKLSIQDCQLATDAEQVITPVSVKKRGRKPVIKKEPAATTPAYISTDEKTVKDGESPAVGVIKFEVNENKSEARTDFEHNIPLKTRKGRVAVKSDHAATSIKSDQKQVNEQISETEHIQGTENHEEVKLNLQCCPLDLANPDEISKPTTVDNQDKTPVPAKKRGRKAAVEVETPASASAIGTPKVRRAGRKQPIEIPVSNADTLNSPKGVNNERDEAKRVSVSSKTSEHKETLDLICTRSVTESSTPVIRGLRRNIAESDVRKTPKSDKITIEIHETKHESEKLSPIPSKTAESSLMLISKAEELVVSSSTPIRRGGRTRVERTNIDNVPTESNTELPKTRGRKAYKKSSKEIEHTIELDPDDQADSNTFDNPVKSEQISPLVQKEEISEKEEKLLKQISKRAFKKATEVLNASSSMIADVQENVPPQKRTRRTPKKLTEFITSNLSQEVKTKILGNKINVSDAEINSPIPSKKRGKPVSAKLENVESPKEDTAPVPKRGRRVIVKNDDHKESAPPRRVGRQYKAKNEIEEDDKNDPSCELISHEEKPEEESKKRTTRRVRALSGGSSSSLQVSEEQHTQIEVKTENKPTRGRPKAALKVNNSAQESTLHTEDEQSASITNPKSNRSRKPAQKAQPENEVPQKKTADLEQIPDSKLEISQHDDKIDKKLKRGRKATTIKPVNNSLDTSKSSPIPKKATRGRKAAANAAAETDNNQNFQLDVQTRSGKDDTDTKPTLKRRNLEVPSNNDQQDTPSKRTRRKPNKLLSDEFIT